MSASQRMRCLSEMDIFGENVLHIASKSKASGFSRHLLTTSRSNQHKTNRHKSMQINRELGVSTARFDFDHTASFQQLNDQKTVESTDLELLLHAGTESGLNIDAWLSVRNEWGETPLMVGCRGGRVDVVRMLMEMVESEEKVAFETTHNMTCLQVAAVRGHTDVVQLLLEKAATTRMVRFDLQSNGASSFSSSSSSSSSSSTTSSSTTSSSTTSFSSFLRTAVVDAFGRDAEITTCQSGRLSTIQLLLHAAMLESRKDEFVEKCLNAVATVHGAGDFSNVVQLLFNTSEKMITERTEEERTEEERRSDGDSSGSTMEGGWNVGEDNNDGSDISSRSSVPSLYSDDDVITFLRDYYTLRRPVVFRKSIFSRHNKKDGWSSVEAWKKNNFLQKYGKHMCEVSAIPYGELYGLKRTKMTIAEYVRSWEKKSDEIFDDESDRSFLFDGGKLYHTTSLQDEIGLPPLALNFTRQHGGARTYLHQFYLGPKGSGAQPHFHGDAWNALIMGRKKWIFHPPPNGEFTTMSVMKSGAMLKKSKTQERKQGDKVSTVQHSGDIVFVPEFWSHATLNLGESIGVAFEFY